MQYNPVRLLIDSRKMNFAIAPVIQKWFVTDIFPTYARAGVKKNAFIESEEIITALSIEQSIDENTNAPFETMYFNNKADAVKWLLEK